MMGLSIIVTLLTAMITFFKPNELEQLHFAAANQYDQLNNDARVFWSIDCWRPENTDELLSGRLNDLITRKNKLNSDSPQVPDWARKRALEGIARGEMDFAVDKKPDNPQVTQLEPPKSSLTIKGPYSLSFRRLTIDRSKPEGE